ITFSEDNLNSWIKQIPKPWMLSQKNLDTLLKDFHRKFPNFYDRLIALNLWRIGTPYGIFCLGEEVGVDKDPIIRIDTSDCTVHVLTTIAFAESQSFKEARYSMIKLHYKPDKNGKIEPTYKSRWHFTSDRLLNHSRTTDITSIICTPSDLETIEIELNRKQNGKQFLDLGWTSKELINFIPLERVNNQIMDKLPRICGVAFVKKSYFKNGIVIAHEGYVINNKNLIHASSKEKMTVNVDFYSYLFERKEDQFDGVMFYEINEG
ncbi:MAG: hypothetical protein CMQ68_04240, partial [Gammaproteobacteria bacterium]|nr:hypothetical protein [Gammaproteobacteria bacterium]